MGRNLIKKELYKQNPKAELSYSNEFNKVYSTLIVIDGVEEIIEFHIPEEEQAESLTDVIDAKLLIRWIK